MNESDRRYLDEQPEDAADSASTRLADRESAGHIGWIFGGMAEFEGRATSFLAEGAAYGERLLFVCEDPRPELWPPHLRQQGRLLIESISAIYGPDRMVEPETQRDTFASVLADALREGYTGLRVMADNSSLVADRERLAVWMRWEETFSAFMAANPVTNLCAFDKTRVCAPSLQTVLGTHRALLYPCQ